MDDIHVDALSRVCGAFGTRRAALRTAGAGVLAAALEALGSGEGIDAKKKHKKKCKKPKVKCKKKCCPTGKVCSSGKCTTPPPAEECQFTKTATLWTLQSNCTITKTIEIPDGVTLDGNGKTITMSGPVSGFTTDVPDDWRVTAGVLANGGSANVQDLTIKGGDLTGSCNLQAAGVEGLAFINTSGMIERVTVENLRLQDDGWFFSDSCGIGISATGTGGQIVNIVDAEVSGSGSAGIVGLSRPSTAGITVTVDGATIATDDEDNTFPNSGIEFSGGPVAGSIATTTITASGNNTIGMFILSPGQTVDVEDVTITCSGQQAGAYIVGASGTISESNFHNCVEGITATGSDLTIQNNTFNVSGAGIFIDLLSSATIKDNTFEGSGPDVFGAVAAVNGGDYTIQGNTVSGFDFGFGFFSYPDYDPVGGDEPVTAEVSGNTITGSGEAPPESFAAGVYFARLATGSVTGNAISNFKDADPGQMSCGIRTDADAGEVTIDDNTFPDPPGNEQNICLDIPLPPAPRAKGKRNETFGIEALRHMRERKSLVSASDHAGRDRRRSKQKNKGGRAHQKRGDKH